MEEKTRYKVHITFTSPLWANLSVSVIGIVMGVLCFIAGIGYFSSASGNAAQVWLGIFYLLGGAAMLAIGIIGVLKAKSDMRGSVIASFGQGLAYCLLSAITNFILAGLYSSIKDDYLYYYGVDLTFTIIMSISVGLLYLFIAVMEGRAMLKLKHNEEPGGVALAGNLLFLILVVVAFILSLTGGLQESTALSIAMYLIIIAMATFLVIIAKKTDVFSQRKVVSDPLPDPEEELEEKENLSETEKADILFEYKELLEEGLITREEFDKKKKEILG